MSRAFDPRLQPDPSTNTRSTITDLREMTDEWTSEKAFEQNRASVEADDEWVKMYSGEKMEENY